MASNGNNSAILEILESSARTQTDFKYKICCSNKLNYTDEYVNFVKFQISRYGNHYHVLKFDEKITEPEAIKKVEEYLSKPITREYFDLVTADIIDWNWSFDNYKDLCRGKLLSGAFFLDCIDKLSDNAISLSVGS